MLDGIKAEFPDAHVTFVPGTQFLRYEGDVVPPSFLTTVDGRPGLTAEFSTGEMWGPQRTVLAERPKLKAFKPAMRSSLAGLHRVPQERVTIKAGTNEGCDAVGRGEAIAAHAVVLLVRASH